jgi:hypothetical protein
LGEKESCGQISPASGRIYFQAARGVDNGVNSANPKPAPLLPIAGEKNLAVTPSMTRATYRSCQKLRAPDELIQSPGDRHQMIAGGGWEDVAGAILAWIEKSTR